MEFCSSEESLLEAQHGRDDSSPQETCKQSEVVDEGENLEPPLSPGLLAELSLTSFTPMRITRRMASMRESFTRSLGISVGEAPEKISEEESGAPLVKKTGKRTAGRGSGRSGWTKNSIIVKESGEEESVLARRRGSKGKQKANGKTLNEVKARGAGKKKGGRKKKLAQEEFGDETDEGGEDVSSGVTEGEPAEKVQAPKMKLKSPGVGWVMCDECQKWRCISSDLADAIEASDVKWTCKENPNRKFADCSVPQEKTNAEINAELNISEISTSEGDDIDAAVSSKSRASWSQIQHNIFHHRQQKRLDDDDTLICHCRAPGEGPGCGDDCLNRMMNVECSPDTCPCGERCSNQQFGKRMYARFELVRCGKKGFGLRASEHIPMGSFIIEYVGEVLDLRAFELRQKEYTREGQKHFYFMTLNSSEVIDACRKGNLGRFINHSCEPNCQTEKWCVNGEICIGLFALRDVKKNEEITFNYNFERLYGAAARRCHCGSRTCSGFIGEPPKPGDVVQSDSEEDLEPMMFKEEESDEENVVNTETSQEMEICTPPEEAKVEQPEPEVEPEVEPEPLREPEPELQVVVKPKLPVAEAKTCRVKRAKAGGRPKKAVFRSFKPITCRSSRTEVEEKLDRLLNPDGGLSKKKDTPKQYLKLLVISTASGDASSEGTSCSMRDLSLLLDAMLKTSSRTILNEVIQKNGLQLLHNLVKQSRKSFTKIPILRKLLKVLELLADRKILSTKEMTSTPPRNGMESFVKSIFELTRHEDMEVQQISRRFQKNWIPDMYDILANDRSSSGNQFVHKYWGPDRFSQKRELFRSKQDDRPLRSKSDEFEEKHQRPQYEEKHQRPQYEERPYNRYDHEERPQKSQFRHSSDHEEKLQRLRHSSEPSEDSRLHQRPSSSSFKRSSDHHEERLQRRDHHEERHHERSRKPEDHPEQEAKRRRKGSRWDELPSMMQVPSVSSLQVQVHSQENGGIRRDESATPTTAVVEQCDSEPPGYSSKANPGNCRRQLEHRAPPEAHHQRIYHPGSSEAHYQRIDHPGSSEAPYRRPLEQKVDRPGSSEALYRRPLEPKIDHLGGSSEACYRSSGSAEAFYRGSGSSEASYRRDHPGSSSEASYRRPPEQKFDRPGSSEGSHRKIDYPGSFEASHRRDQPGSFEASHRRDRSVEQKIEPPGTSEACYRRPGSSEGSGSYRRSIEPPGTGEAPYRRPGSSEGAYRRSLEPKIEPPGTSGVSYWRPESSEASYRRSSLEQKIEPPGTSEVSYHRRSTVDHPGISYDASYRRPGSSEASSYRKSLEQKIEPPGTCDASYRGSSHGAPPHRAPENHHPHQVHQAIDHSITGAPPYRRASETDHHHHYSSGASGVVSYRSQSSQYQASPGGFSAAPPRHNQWHRQQPASYRPQPSYYTNQTGASLYQQQQQSHQFQQQQGYLEAAPVTSHYNSYDQGYQSGYYQQQQQQQQHKFAGHHQPGVAAAAAPVCYPSSHLVSVVHHQQQAPVAAPPGGSQFPGHCYSSQLHAPPQDEEPPVPGL